MIGYMNVRLNGRRAVPESIRAGNCGDHRALGIRFLLPEALAEAQVTLYLEQEGFADAAALEDGVFVPTRTHTSRPGKWNAYLSATMGEDTVWNSDPFVLSIGDLPKGEEQIEQQYPTVIEQAMRTAATVAGTKAEAETLPAGASATVTVQKDDDGNQTLVFGIPKGDQGIKGDPGAVFVPHMNENGVLSWTNDGDLPNPPAVDVLRKAQFDESIAAANQAAQTARNAAASADVAIAELQTYAAPAIMEQAAGEWICVQECVDRPLQGLKLHGKTTLSGTPSKLLPAALACCGKGSFRMTVCGKNLADLPDRTLTTAGYVYEKRAIRLGPGTYVFSCEHNLAQNAGWWVALYDADGVRLHEAFTGTGQQNSAVLTISKPAAAISVYADAAVRMRRMQLEMGQTPGAYEKWKGKSLDIPILQELHGVPVDSDGNYTDASGQQWCTDEVDVVSGSLTRRTCIKVFDGTEKVNLNNQNQFYITLSQRGDSGKNQLCTHFTWGDNDAYKSLKDNSIEARGSNAWLYSTAFATTAEVKAFFAQQYAAGTPMTLVYAMETPVNESGVQAEDAVKQMQTYSEATYALGDGRMGMEITYVADTKKWILGQLAAMTSGLMGL